MKLSPLNPTQMRLLALASEGAKLQPSFNAEECIVMICSEWSDFDRLGLSKELNFVGANPKPVIADAYSYSYRLGSARHFAKTTTYSSYYELISEEETYWSEIDQEDADYYSMTLLEDNQWAFSPCVPNVCS